MKGNPAQPQCGFSRAVVQILDVQGVPMEKMHTYNCLDDQELREGIKEYSCVPFASSSCRSPPPDVRMLTNSICEFSSDWPTIPQVYLKGEFLGGCDILMGMHSSGELEELLVKEGIISLEEELSDGSAEPEKKD